MKLPLFLISLTALFLLAGCDEGPQIDVRVKVTYHDQTIETVAHMTRLENLIANVPVGETENLRVYTSYARDSFAVTAQIGPKNAGDTLTISGQGLHVSSDDYDTIYVKRSNRSQYRATQVDGSTPRCSIEASFTGAGNLPARIQDSVSGLTIQIEPNNGNK